MDWPIKLIEKLKQLYPDISTKQVALKLNRPYGSVKAKAKALGLRKAPGFNRMADTRLSVLPAEKKFICDNYQKYTNHELARITGRAEATIQKIRKEFGLSKENAGRFQKGIVPWSAGKKMPPGWGGATRFKKGQKPHNTKFDGAISVRKSKGRPYTWVRIAEGEWRELHRVMWEKTMGEIPEGYNVQFRDGNSLNCEPANLYIINRNKQMLQNSIQLYPADLRNVMLMLGRYNRKLKDYAEKQN